MYKYLTSLVCMWYLYCTLFFILLTLIQFFFMTYLCFTIYLFVVLLVPHNCFIGFYILYFFIYIYIYIYIGTFLTEINIMY